MEPINYSVKQSNIYIGLKTFDTNKKVLKICKFEKLATFLH